MASASTSPSATVWYLRAATVVLVAALAWDALDTALLPHPVFVLATYFFLGFVSAAAFPRRVWVGIFVAIIAALSIELLQSLVPFRDVRTVELIAKWLSTTAGIVIQLALVFLGQRTQRPR